MLGPPGAGKGTQAERFARDRGIPRISTGDILREAVQGGSALGREAKAVMDRGELVGDELMIGIVRERLAQPDAAPGFVLDGFPRTVTQAEALDRMLAGGDGLVIVQMEVPDEELVRRVRARRVCQSCGTLASAFGDGARQVCDRCGGTLVSRSDDAESVVRDRLKVYWRDTRPLIEFYGTRATYRAVDGAQPPEQVRAAVEAAVKSVTAKATA
jgi:adenylate kinase